MPPINARILARRIPNAELEIVPDAGHLLLIDHAEPLAERIATFLGLPAQTDPRRLVAAARSHERLPTLGSSS